MIEIDSPHTLGKLRQINTWRSLTTARLDGLRKGMLQADHETGADLKDAVDSLCDALEEAVTQEWDRRKCAVRGELPPARVARPDTAQAARIIEALTGTHEPIVVETIRTPEPAPTAVAAEADARAPTAPTAETRPAETRADGRTRRAAGDRAADTMRGEPDHCALRRQPRRLFAGPGRGGTSFAEIARAKRERGGIPPGVAPCSPWARLRVETRGKRAGGPGNLVCPLSQSGVDRSLRDRPPDIAPAVGHAECATRRETVRAA